ncbi:hypothetical protein [Janthinobacterium agaricidamnosum]|nr:hypothetical protein [Janthinobacterium agaricidamnosum]
MRTPSYLPAFATPDKIFTSALTRMALATALLATGFAQASGVDWRGKIDLRAVESDTDQSWTDSGLGKSRYDRHSSRFSLGQAVLRGDLDLLDTVNGAVLLSASDQHHGVVDIQEAWLGWNPLPSGAWKMRVKAGYFFPPTSVEVEYGGIDWTPGPHHFQCRHQ